MKQKESKQDNKANILNLKKLRSLAYQQSDKASIPGGITVVAEDDEQSTSVFALNRLSISVANPDEEVNQ